jgi:hypothetical protein
MILKLKQKLILIKITIHTQKNNVISFQSVKLNQSLQRKVFNFFDK